MKRLISAAAVCVLLLCLTVSAFAAGTQLEVSSAQAHPGDTVDVTVSIKGNPGYAGFDLIADYDSDVLEMTGFKLSRVSGALSSAAADTGMATFASLTSVTEDGVIATMTFRVRDGAPAGDTSVGLAGADFFNIDENAVPVDVVYGSVTVLSDAGEDDRPPTEPSDGNEPEEQEQPQSTATPTPEPQPTIPPGEESVKAEISERTDIPAALTRVGVDPGRTVVYDIHTEDGDLPVSGFVEVTVPYPEEAENGSVFRAYMIDPAGGVEELPAEEGEEGLTVVTDAENSVSVSWLTPEEDAAAREAERVENAAETAEESSGTGSAVLWIVIVAVIIAAAAVIVILRRRKK